MVKKIRRKKLRDQKKHSKWMLLATHPLAIEADYVQPFQLDLESEYPKAAIRSISPELNDQMMKGGSYISVEYESEEKNIISAINEGMGLVEDIGALLSLTAGLPKLECKPIQIVRVYDHKDTCEFVYFFTYHDLKWHDVLTKSDLQNLQKIFMHWKGLKTGDRIRRAMKRYGESIGRENLQDAFQFAFMGLEALEKPLAEELGIESGVEVLKDKCKYCGKVNERRKPALNAVKQHVYGMLHTTHKARKKQGETEWRKITKLRNALFHAYEDPEKLADKAYEILPAVLHHLYNACAHLSHVHELESNEYRQPSIHMAYLLYIGEVKLKKALSITDWSPILDTKMIQWVKTEDVMTPRFTTSSQWYSERVAKSIEGSFYMLKKPLSVAEENDIEPVRFIDDSETQFS